MPREPRPRRITVSRWIDANGQQVPANTPGARRRTSKSDTYYAKIKGTRYPLNTTDEAEAWAAFRRLQKRLRDEDLGIATPEQEQAVKPLASHLDDFLAYVASKGTGAKEIGEQRSQITRLAGLAGWKRVGDITRDSCLVALGRVMSELGRSQDTRNHYLARVKAFAAWLANTEPPRLLRDPLRGVKKIAVTEIRHRRRCPSASEIVVLMEYLHGPTARMRKGMTGPQRALAYRLAMATGFRSNEVRSLERSSFDLDRGTVRLAPSVDKRRKGAVQPLPSWLVEELRQWFAAGGGLWIGFPDHWGGRILRADLKAAGVEYETPEGFLDFHALRVYYITALASQPGIDPKTLLTLSRHSKADLSLKVYARQKEEQARKAVENLPRDFQVTPKVTPTTLAQSNKDEQECTDTDDDRARGGK